MRAERRWGRRADSHLAVSQALADWLKRQWSIPATVLYDRPTAFFAKPSLDAASELWQRLARDLNLGSRRLPLVVCPTSWTPDEDFDLLLEALLNTLWQGMLIAALVWLLLRFIKRVSATTRHAVWLVTLLTIGALPMVGAVANRNVPGPSPAAPTSRHRSPVPHARSATSESGCSASSRTVRRRHPTSSPNVITLFTRS